MVSPSSADRFRVLVVGLCVGVPILFALVAVLLPQDNNWDLRNYHWYNPYALLEGRMGFDLAPAQTPTFYNPLLDVPFFLAAQAFPARILAFVLGLIQGCNFILLFFLARRTLTLKSDAAGILAAAAIALVGLVGAGHIPMIGTTFYDNILSLLVLGAMLTVVSAADLLTAGPMRAALVRVFVAGVLVGLAVGFKLPSQVFAVGVCFGLLFIPGALMRRFWLSFSCGLGVISGFLVTGAWWIARMWSDFGNPLFPYMNHIFKSPWALAENYRDTRFLPQSLWDALTFPFRFVADSKISSEISFTDGRIALACAVLVMTGVIVVMHRRTAAPRADIFAMRYLAAASALSYGVWLAIFAIYRYVMPLEMLAPLLIVAGIALWPVSGRARVGISAALLLLVTATVRIDEDWTRKAWGPGLGGRFVEVSPPAFADPSRTLILMAGLAPTAFVIPSFPSEIAFLRPVSYLAGPDHSTRFIETLKARIAAHSGEIFTLQPEWERHAVRDSFPLLGLAADFESCRKLPNAHDNTIEICPVRRQP
jgi:hypothetical protein